MKRLIATTAVLFVLLASSDADAGIMYGTRVANRLSTGTGRFTRFYRWLGRLEYRKDMWLLGRPIGDAPPDYCPECGQPMSTHYNYYYNNQNQTQPNQEQPNQSQPMPTPAKPMPKANVENDSNVLAAPPVSNE